MHDLCQEGVRIKAIIYKYSNPVIYNKETLRRRGESTTFLVYNKFIVWLGAREICQKHLY